MSEAQDCARSANAIVTSSRVEGENDAINAMERAVSFIERRIPDAFGLLQELRTAIARSRAVALTTPVEVTELNLDEATHKTRAIFLERRADQRDAELCAALARIAELESGEQ